MTRGREREKGDRERKKGKRESEGGRENGKDVCKSMSMADSSTKSPDIYSALLTNLKKKKKKSIPPSLFFFYSFVLHLHGICLCAHVSELVFSMYNNGNESKADMLKVHLKASQVFPLHPACLQMQNTLAEYLFTLLMGMLPLL